MKVSGALLDLQGTKSMSVPVDGRFGLYGAYDRPKTKRDPDSNCLQHAKSHIDFLAYAQCSQGGRMAV